MYFKKQWEANLQECTVKMMNTLIDHYNEDIRDLDREIIEFQKQNMSLCAHPKFLAKNTFLREHIEKCNKDLIYKKDIKFIRDKIAFNGKYAYRWPQQGGKKTRNNQDGYKGPRKSEIDTAEGTDSDSSYVSHTSRFSHLSQPLGRGSRGSRKRHNTGDGHNGGGKGKKKKGTHL